MRRDAFLGLSGPRQQAAIQAACRVFEEGGDAAAQADARETFAIGGWTPEMVYGFGGKNDVGPLHPVLGGDRAQESTP